MNTETNPTNSMTKKRLESGIKRTVFTSIIAGSVLFMTGCNDTKEASKDNFKETLNQYLGDSCFLVSDNRRGFPTSFAILPKEKTFLSMKDQWERDAQVRYDALVDLGLLKTEVDTEQSEKTYNLTEAGKTAYTNDGWNSLSSGRAKAGVCVTRFEVDEVLRFTEPSAKNGYTVSRVWYSVSLAKDEQAKQETLFKAFPELTEVLSSQKEQSAILVLMNDQWVHEKSINH
ncbi:hypothetical protein KDW99_01440 [Marinomonas rhizomae]|uniref:hypothetical protein n=1 Tax=Marinomonas rhizomae TaxID=491948 RepID=UPI00210384A1|nr:hypothetical protein [Marinomonas rhizomae]UTV99840.1 hypothetical protein KDW99_01440 [Marinomonas rhizomae]